MAQEQLRKNIEADSLKGYYEYIYKKHNFEKETFEHSLGFYAKHPEILNKAYDKIILAISKRDSISKKRRNIQVDTIQLWREQSNYTVEKYTKNTLSFKIPANYPNTYYISADIKVYDDSQIKNFTPVFGFIASDTIYAFNATKIKADTIFQPIQWKQMATDTTITHLVGDFAPQGDSTEIFKHYEIKNIKIYTTQIDTVPFGHKRLLIDTTRLEENTIK